MHVLPMGRPMSCLWASHVGMAPHVLWAPHPHVAGGERPATRGQAGAHPAASPCSNCAPRGCLSRLPRCGWAHRQSLWARGLAASVGQARSGSSVCVVELLGGLQMSCFGGQQLTAASPSGCSTLLLPHCPDLPLLSHLQTRMRNMGAAAVAAAATGTDMKAGTAFCTSSRSSSRGSRERGRGRKTKRRSGRPGGSGRRSTRVVTTRPVLLLVGLRRMTTLGT